MAGGGQPGNQPSKHIQPKAIMKKLLLILAGLIPALGFGQNYTIDWYKIAGGGGTSAGGTYQVNGTIGQPDASQAMTGGS